MEEKFEGTERFTILVSGQGLVIRDREGKELRFTSSEALMLLDILQQEEKSLEKMAEESSPLPIRISLRRD
jgi:hypothetical protein